MPNQVNAPEIVLLAPLCWDEVVDRGGIRVRPGGVGLYAAWALARRGARVRLHTPLAPGETELLAALPERVEVTLHPSHETTRFRIESHPGRPDDRNLTLLAASDSLDPMRIDHLDAAASILFGPLLPSDLDASLAAFLHGCLRPVDIGVQGLVRTMTPRGMVSLTAFDTCSLLSPLRILAGDEQEIAMLPQEDRDVPAEIVTTQGRRGAQIRLRGSAEPIEIDAITPKRPVHQRIGLGDTFLAVYGLERSFGAGPRAAGDSAAAAAATLMEEGLPFRPPR